MEFAGWYRDSALTVPWSFGDNVTGDMTLYAQWASESRETGPTYRVSFVTGITPALPDVTGISPGSRMVAPPAPVMDGCRLNGWYKDEALSERWDFSTDRVTCDFTLYAGWAALHEVRYYFPVAGVAESDWEMETAHFAIGDVVDLMKPSRAPYTFGGWFKMIGGVNHVPGDSDPDNLAPYPDGSLWSLDGDMDLYAHWEGTEGLNYERSAPGHVTIGSVSDTTATSVAVPEYYRGEPVLTVKSYAFSSCALLRSVHLPDTLEYIGSNAFIDLTSLTDVNLPSSLDTIEYYAFSGCTGLSWNDPVLPSKLRMLNEFAFSGCIGITGELTLPPTLRYLGGYAFKDCPGISSVRIPYEMAAQCAIYNYAFGGTTNATIYVDAESDGPGWIQQYPWNGTCRVVYLRP
jgi:uncharacterized repeat protein (TIGR02543 family)